jgi:hypothetical protein
LDPAGSFYPTLHIAMAREPFTDDPVARNGRLVDISQRERNDSVEDGITDHALMTADLLRLERAVGVAAGDSATTQRQVFRVLREAVRIIS